MTLYTDADLHHGSGAFDQVMRSQTSFPGRAHPLSSWPTSPVQDDSKLEGLNELRGLRRRKRVRSRPLAAMPTPDELQAQREAWERERAKEARREREFWVSHQDALLALGVDMPDASGRSTFTHAGCVAALLATIADGKKRRDQILEVMRKRFRYSYRHAGFLLTKLTGTDPSQHLWSKSDDRTYQLVSQAILVCGSEELDDSTR